MILSESLCKSFAFIPFIDYNPFSFSLAQVNIYEQKRNFLVISWLIVVAIMSADLFSSFSVRTTC